MREQMSEGEALAMRQHKNEGLEALSGSPLGAEGGTVKEPRKLLKLADNRETEVVTKSGDRLTFLLDVGSRPASIRVTGAEKISSKPFGGGLGQS